MDLHHRASAFIAKRVQLGLLPSFRSRGLTLFSLWVTFSTNSPPAPLLPKEADQQ